VILTALIVGVVALNGVLIAVRGLLPLRIVRDERTAMAILWRSLDVCTGLMLIWLASILRVTS